MKWNCIMAGPLAIAASATSAQGSDFGLPAAARSRQGRSAFRIAACVARRDGQRCFAKRALQHDRRIRQGAAESPFVPLHVNPENWLPSRRETFTAQAA